VDYIDTRDLAEELADLELRADFDPEDDVHGDELDDDERERMTAIRELLDSIGDARYGVTLIPESEFEDYARELAEDIGAVDSDYGWPHSCIDWKQAADELRMDYSSVTFDGVDYLYRA